MCVTTTANNFQNNLNDYLNTVIESEENVCVATDNGNVIIMSEEEYRSIKETIYLLSIPGMKEKLLDGAKQPSEKCTVWNGEI